MLVDGEAGRRGHQRQLLADARHGIALAFSRPTVEIGDEVAIDIRGEPVPATVVEAAVRGQPIAAPNPSPD